MPWPFRKKLSHAEMLERRAREQYMGLVGRAREQYRQLDFGRVFGWWLRIDGLRVAELNYRRFDWHSQFWHEYHVVPCSERFAELGTDPHRWAQGGVSAESRYVSGYVSTGFLMSQRSEVVVALRFLSIPEDEFVAAYLKAEGA